MPDISSLLSRAAELAPDLVWYVPDDRLHKHGMIYMIGGAPLYDLDEPEAHALILYAVLKECERRGLGLGWYRDILLRLMWGSTHDPAHTALAGFVALLEAELQIQESAKSGVS